tara:strand:+ start:8037 stop:9011 length:975 start_codon:yes stop_codon:yes gene_type:complete
MKPLYILFFSFFVFLACVDKTKTSNKYKRPSVGNINTLQVVTPDRLWADTVGGAIRAYFASPTPGLPQDEPLFSMSQMPPKVFSGFVKTYRLFLHITLGETDTIAFRKNPYAAPQIGVFITATSQEKLAALIKENAPKILSTFKSSEIKERQRRTKISKLKLDSLPSTFGITLEIPSAYHIAKSASDFYWIRKELKYGNTNVIVYQVPLSAIPEKGNIIDAIIKMRDSVGIKHLPVEDDGQFITEAAYAPYLKTTVIDSKFAYETKGTWEIKNQWMAGPFVNYAIKDEKNNRYLVLEGFAYAPRTAKRNLQLELESILKSVRIK